MKLKFHWTKAEPVARQLEAALASSCERAMAAGSLRRGKPEVGDVEILYIPRITKVAATGELFPSAEFANQAHTALEQLLATGVLTKRRNVCGIETWGESNKLALHVASGIPVDLFAATEANWFNYLVCRTGSADNNKRIAMAAQRKGWKWNPYGVGFTDEEGNPVKVESEQDVFRLVGLPYLEPHER